MTDVQALTGIIGIGSHHGIDQLGWLACDQLKTLQWPRTVTIHSCRTPAQLTELLSRYDKAILVDAILHKPPAGEILTLRLQDLEQNTCARHSSHGLGVVEAVELARALGQLPSTLTILGVTVTDSTEDAGSVSRRIAPALQQTIIDLVDSPMHGNALT